MRTLIIPRGNQPIGSPVEIVRGPSLVTRSFYGSSGYAVAYVPDHVGPGPARLLPRSKPTDGQNFDVEIPASGDWILDGDRWVEPAGDVGMWLWERELGEEDRIAWEHSKAIEASGDDGIPTADDLFDDERLRSFHADRLGITTPVMLTITVVDADATAAASTMWSITPEPPDITGMDGSPVWATGVGVDQSDSLISTKPITDTLNAQGISMVSLTPTSATLAGADGMGMLYRFTYDAGAGESTPEVLFAMPDSAARLEDLIPGSTNGGGVMPLTQVRPSDLVSSNTYNDGQVASATSGDEFTWVDNAGGGGGGTPLSMAQVIDRTSTTFGTVSGMRLSEAVAAFGVGAGVSSVTGTNGLESLSDVFVGDVQVGVAPRGVTGARIALATIGQENMAPDSVGRDQMRDQSVGVPEIITNGVGVPGQVMVRAGTGTGFDFSNVIDLIGAGQISRNLIADDAIDVDHLATTSAGSVGDILFRTSLSPGMTWAPFEGAIDALVTGSRDAGDIMESIGGDGSGLRWTAAHTQPIDLVVGEPSSPPIVGRIRGIRPSNTETAPSRLEYAQSGRGFESLMHSAHLGFYAQGPAWGYNSGNFAPLNRAGSFEAGDFLGITALFCIVGGPQAGRIFMDVNGTGPFVALNDASEVKMYITPLGSDSFEDTFSTTLVDRNFWTADDPRLAAVRYDHFTRETPIEIGFSREGDFMDRAGISAADDPNIPIASDPHTGILIDRNSLFSELAELGQQLRTDLAPKASPVFTGTPEAPDPPAASNDQSIATTAWARANITGGGSPPFDIHDQVTNEATPATVDHFIFSDEGSSGDPMRYVSGAGLAAFIQGQTNLSELANVPALGNDGQVLTISGTSLVWDTPTAGGGGLTQAQVDARVRVGVIDQAETGNTDEWDVDKLPLPSNWSSARATDVQLDAGSSTVPRPLSVHDITRVADQQTHPPVVQAIPDSFMGNLIYLEHDEISGNREDVTVTAGVDSTRVGYRRDSYGSVSGDVGSLRAIFGSGTISSYELAQAEFTDYGAASGFEAAVVNNTDFAIGTNPIFQNGRLWVRSLLASTNPGLTSSTFTLNFRRADGTFYFLDGSIANEHGLYEWDPDEGASGDYVRIPTGLDVSVAGVDLEDHTDRLEFTGGLSGNKATGSRTVELHFPDPDDHSLPKVSVVPGMFSGNLIYLEHTYSTGTKQDITVTVGSSGGFVGFDREWTGNFGSTSVGDIGPLLTLVGEGTSSDYSISVVGGVPAWVDAIDNVDIAGTVYSVSSPYYDSGVRLRNILNPPTGLSGATFAFDAQLGTEWYWTDGSTTTYTAGLYQWDSVNGAYEHIGYGVDVQRSGTDVVAGALAIDFTGQGVTVSDVSGIPTVNIPGGGGGSFSIHDDVGAVAVPSASDRFIFSDESAVDDVNRYVTGGNLANFISSHTSLSELNNVPALGSDGQVLTISGTDLEWATPTGGGTAFNLHDDVGTVGVPASADRFLFSDESTADDPNRYVTGANLAAFVASENSGIPVWSSATSYTRGQFVRHTVTTGRIWLAEQDTVNDEPGTSAGQGNWRSIQPSTDMHHGVSPLAWYQPGEVVLGGTTGISSAFLCRAVTSDEPSALSPDWFFLPRGGYVAGIQTGATQYRSPQIIHDGTTGRMWYVHSSIFGGGATLAQILAGDFDNNLTELSPTGVTVQEEGTATTSLATTLNFVGAGVTATDVSGVATITIPGGGSGAAFNLHDDVGTPAAIDPNDRFVFSDESAVDDPNRYATAAAVATFVGGRTNISDLANVPSLGSNGQVLGISGGVPAWITATGSFDIHDDVMETDPPTTEDHFIFSDESASGDPNRFISGAGLAAFIQGQTNIEELANVPALSSGYLRYTGSAVVWSTAPTFDIQDDVTTEATVGQGDRIIFADQSVTGDPMRYTTVEDFSNYVAAQTGLTELSNVPSFAEGYLRWVSGTGLEWSTPSVDFNIHDSVTTAAVPAVTDRFIFSDESDTDDPNKYVTGSNLANFIAGQTALSELSNVPVLGTDGQVLTISGTDLEWADAAGGVSLSTDTPAAVGTATAGTSTEASRSDHVHALSAGAAFTAMVSITPSSGTALQVGGAAAGNSTIMSIITPDSGQQKAFGAQRDGETWDFVQFAGNLSGPDRVGLALGDGTQSRDTNLYRDAANVLKTDDSFTVGTNLLVEGTASGETPTADAHFATKGYVDTNSGGDLDISADITREAVPSSSDHFIFSDEGSSGAPTSYAEGSALANFVAGQVNLSQLANVPTLASGVLRSDGSSLAWGPGLDIKDDVGTAAVPTTADHFIFSDESASGDPNRYVTGSGLANFIAGQTTLNELSGVPTLASGYLRYTGSALQWSDPTFNLHDDISGSGTTIADDDRMLFSDESASGDPNAYTTASGVRTYIRGGSTPRVYDGSSEVSGSRDPRITIGDTRPSSPSNGDIFLQVS